MSLKGAQNALHGTHAYEPVKGSTQTGYTSMDKNDFFAERDTSSGGPLDGIRVLEATNYASGPVCGMILADLGATSVKCEMPGAGDPNRLVPPFISGDSDRENSVVFAGINRGKLGVTLDFRTEQGQELFRKVAATCDIVVENFSPGTMDRWNIGYADIKAVKPDIIYVSISGFGQFGPLHKRRGFDPVAQAMGGLMSITGEPDGRPLKAGSVLADDMAGWQAALGALAALHYRTRTGKGQWVDTSMTDAQLYASSWGIMGAVETGTMWPRTGNAIAGGAPMNSYLCADGEWLIIFAAFDKTWRTLCELMDRPDLLEDPRSKDWPARSANVDFVDGEVAKWVATQNSHELDQLLDEKAIVSAPILNFEQIINTPHYHERDMIYKAEHPRHGPITHFGVANKFSVSDARIRRAAPLLGEHNDEIFGGQLGMSEADLQRLRDEGVI